MVEVEFNEKDYKIILAWYEIAFASDPNKQKEIDLEVMHKLMCMCKAIIDEQKKNEMARMKLDLEQVLLEAKNSKEELTE